MNFLPLSKEAPLPLDAATSKLAWFGENGAGKTYGAMKLAELMWAAGIQFVALDPVGPWHGLRIGKEGDGLPIVIFGGLHGDIPIRPQDGPRIAEVIVHEGISAVIDVSQFETDYAKAQFASEFAERFYFLKKTHPSAVHLFLEEAQEFVPENPSGGPNSKDTLMANRIQRIWKIGRNYGIGGSLISQRPQEISKKALNLSGAVFVFRLTGPHERDYMTKWLAGYGEKPELPSIATGRPYLWSPAWLKHSGFIQIEEKQTHDVSATPKVGEVFKARTLTAVAVQALRESLIEIIEEEDNDVDALKAKIKELENSKGLQSETIIAREVALAIKPLEDRNVYLEGVIQELGEISERIRILCGSIHRVGEIEAEDRSLEIPDELKITAPTPKPKREPVPPAEGLSKGAVNILHALATLRSLGRKAADRRVVAVLAGQSPKSGSYGQNLAALRRENLIETTGEGLSLTDEGSKRAPTVEKPSSLADYHRAWKQHLTATQGRMLDRLIALHPKSVTRKELADLTSQSEKSGSFGQNLAKLRSFRLIEGSKDLRGAGLLFPGGLK